MIRSATLASALWIVGLASNGLAQTFDTARVRVAYDSVRALRAQYERGHNILQSRPDWLVRDAVELLEQVRRRRR